MSDREPVNLGYPYVESFHSDFSGTGGVDQSDRSTNINEHTIEDMRQIPVGPVADPAPGAVGGWTCLPGRHRDRS